MLTNFHTHTCFCDGKDEPEEMVRRAMELGFTALGFSGHSDNGFDPCGMTPEKEVSYRAEVARLKEEYKGNIEIFCGIEQDIFSGARDPYYDYAIGSVHWLWKNGEFWSVDWTAEKTEEAICDAFRDDPYGYAEAYFATVARVREITGCDVIGHFDLLRKFDEDGEMFDEEHPRYRAAVLRALDALSDGKPVFELNTGAMARGYRKTPFPSLWILREIKKRGCPIVLSTDCHDSAFLDCGYDDMVSLAREAGYTEQMVFTEVGWRASAL